MWGITHGRLLIVARSRFLISLYTKIFMGNKITQFRGENISISIEVLGVKISLFLLKFRG